MGYGTILHNGYIIAVTDVGDMTQAEYAAAVSALHSKPTGAPDGYAYRLRTDLTWELGELPPAPEEPTVYTQSSLETMTNAELEQILYGYGITASMNKANMIRLILDAQGDETE